MARRTHGKVTTVMLSRRQDTADLLALREEQNVEWQTLLAKGSAAVANVGGSDISYGETFPLFSEHGDWISHQYTATGHFGNYTEKGILVKWVVGGTGGGDTVVYVPWGETRDVAFGPFSDPELTFTVATSYATESLRGLDHYMWIEASGEVGFTFSPVPAVRTVLGEAVVEAWLLNPVSVAALQDRGCSPAATTGATFVVPASGVWDSVPVPVKGDALAFVGDFLSVPAWECRQVRGYANGFHGLDPAPYAAKVVLDNGAESASYEFSVFSPAGDFSVDVPFGAGFVSDAGATITVTVQVKETALDSWTDVAGWVGALWGPHTLSSTL